ncbi:MAG: MBG domain-containing protein [Terracidiphilus sp.]
MSQTTDLGPFSGSTVSSSNPVGGNMAVTPDGDAILSTTTGGTILLYNSRTGKQTVLAKPSGQTGAVATNGNLFIALNYGGGAVVTLPLGTPFTNLSFNTPSCNESAGECVMTTVTAGANFPIVSMAFDAQGDLFYAIQADSVLASTSGISYPNSIWECNTSCLLDDGGPASVMIYQEPAPTTFLGSPFQLTLGGLAIDPWGNIFFTDGFVDGTGDANKGNIYQTFLKELPLVSGKYATTPTTLVTNDQSAAPGPSVDAITSVNVDASGTVYFSDLENGIAAIPNNGTALTESGAASTMYLVSLQGFKEFALGLDGAILGSAHSNADNSDAEMLTYVNSARATASPVGVKATSNLAVVDNLADCTTPPAINITTSQNGAASNEFSAAVSGSCSNTFTGGSQYAVSLQFDPADVGERLAVLTATDTTNASSVTSTVSGVGQGPLVALDPGVTTSYSTYTTGFTAPNTVSVDAAGDLAIADPRAGKVYEIVHGTSTLTPVGNFEVPYGAAFDANGNLFVSDGEANEIEEIPNVNETLNTAGQTTIVANTVLFGSKPLDTPGCLAFGPDGLLYISDTNNSRVVSYNLTTGATADRAEASLPRGIAVDASGTLYVADQLNAFEINGGFGASYGWFVAGSGANAFPEGISIPWGVAVDASGSVFVSDAVSGNIVRVPNVGGTLQTANAITVATYPDGVYGIALDSAGNLYAVDENAATVYAVQRTAASVNFGSVDDNSSVASPIYVENAGNMALTFGSPLVTAPSNSNFKLGVGGCTGTSLAVGVACGLSADFAPANATPAGVLTATSTLSSNALNAPSATLSFSGTAVFESPKSQTISFTPPATVAFTTTPITLSATATSGLPVTIALVSGPATLSGNKLTLTGLGTVELTANQAGNSSYLAAPAVRATIAVTKGAQSITGFKPPANVAFGVGPITLSAKATSGLPVTFGLTSGPATLHKDVLTIMRIGKVKVAANQSGNANYDAAAQVVATITVSKGSQTISFKPPATASYGETIKLTAKATSNLPVKFSLISGPAKLVGDELTITGAGAVKVGANQAGNADFDEAPEVIKKITAGSATLVVKANNLTITEGSAVPQLTYTITGFAAGDKEANVVSGSPTLTTTATSNSKPGKYTITVKQGHLGIKAKYTALYSSKFGTVNGTLTVKTK